jgi:hypothetical protein
MRKPNMTQTLLFILVIGIGLFYAIKYGNKAKKDIADYQQKTEKQTEQNSYSDMRKMAFSVTAEQLELNGTKDNDVYGIIAEMDMGGAIATVVTFIPGDTSLYLSTGAGFIGAGQHEDVRKIVKRFVENGQQYLVKANKIEKPELPKSGITNFNFLTGNGIYSIAKNTSELESGKSEFSNLFAELNEVITQIRLKSGG